MRWVIAYSQTKFHYVNMNYALASLARCGQMTKANAMARPRNVKYEKELSDYVYFFSNISFPLTSRT